MAQTSLLDKIKFNPIVYQRNDAELSQLAKTFETFRAMHEEAIERKTKLETAVANAPLDESEEWYKQAILDTIQTTINEKTDGFGLAGAAQAINQLTADIINSKEFRGKTAANAAHKEFVKKIDDDKSLTDMEKKWYKLMNPYEYDNNLVDEEGKEVMYKWEPTFDVVHFVDMDELYKDALMRITSVKPGGYWVNYDENGRVIIPGYGKLVANELGGYEYLKPSTIKKAIKDEIENNDLYKEGFLRRFQIYKFFGLINDNSYTIEDFIDDQIDGYAGTKAFAGAIKPQASVTVDRSKPKDNGDSKPAKKTQAQKSQEASMAVHGQGNTDKTSSTGGSNRQGTGTSKSTNSKGGTKGGSRPAGVPTKREVKRG